MDREQLAFFPKQLQSVQNVRSNVVTKTIVYIEGRNSSANWLLVLALPLRPLILGQILTENPSVLSPYAGSKSARSSAYFPGLPRTPTRIDEIKRADYR
jgi:hypothetical protein